MMCSGSDDGSSAAVKALVAGVLARDEVTTIVATTYPDLLPSIRVLEKSGFVLVRQEPGTGLLRYERSAER